MGKDGYKIKREAYTEAAAANHAMFCYFFGKPFEPIPEVRQRLDAHLKAHTIDKMTQEIAELNGGGDD